MLWLSKRLPECKFNTVVGDTGSSGQRFPTGGPLPGPLCISQGPDSKPTCSFRMQLPRAAVLSACSKGDKSQAVLEIIFKK